ncbi:family protein [Stylonychia lemnae]|uniref:Family protein n=1 Tax=Stylonychia lemnae TaxID=5949 RepID=A0A077ZT09_STYLE|nr:family protein [Stylonychia lemnae]|eukprot:CDW72694.1 family protein [Stylonychia lemnae]
MEYSLNFYVQEQDKKSQHKSSTTKTNTATNPNAGDQVITKTTGYSASQAQLLSKRTYKEDLMKSSTGKQSSQKAELEEGEEGEDFEDGEYVEGDEGHQENKTGNGNQSDYDSAEEIIKQNLRTQTNTTGNYKIPKYSKLKGKSGEQYQIVQQSSYDSNSDSYSSNSSGNNNNKKQRANQNAKSNFNQKGFKQNNQHFQQNQLQNQQQQFQHQFKQQNQFQKGQKFGQQQNFQQQNLNQKKKFNQQNQQQQNKQKPGLGGKKNIQQQQQDQFYTTRQGKRFKPNQAGGQNGPVHGTTYMNSKLCKYIVTNTCHRGADCDYSHDLHLFPCKYLHGTGFCEKGQGCKFSHKLLANEEIQKFMQENEEFLMEIRQKQGKTNLSDYFERYIKNKEMMQNGQQKIPDHAMISPGLMMIPENSHMQNNPLLGLNLMQNQPNQLRTNNIGGFGSSQLLNQGQGQQQFQSQNLVSQIQGLLEVPDLKKLLQPQTQNILPGALNIGQQQQLQPQNQILNQLLQQTTQPALNNQTNILQALLGQNQQPQIQQQQIQQQNSQVQQLLSLLGQNQQANQQQQQQQQQPIAAALQSLLMPQNQAQLQTNSLAAALQDPRSQQQIQAAQLLQQLNPGNNLLSNDIQQQTANVLNNLMKSIAPAQQQIQQQTLTQLNQLNPVQNLLNSLQQASMLPTNNQTNNQNQLPQMNMQQPQLFNQQLLQTQFGSDQLLTQLQGAGMVQQHQQLLNPQLNNITLGVSNQMKNHGSNQQQLSNNEVYNPYDPRKKAVEKKSQVARDLENLYNKLQQNKEASLQRSLSKVSEPDNSESNQDSIAKDNAKSSQQSKVEQKKQTFKSNDDASSSEEGGFEAKSRKDSGKKEEGEMLQKVENQEEFFNTGKKLQTEQAKQSLKDKLALSGIIRKN